MDHGAIMFGTYVTAQLLMGWLSGDGFDTTFVIGALAGALVFAGVGTGLHMVLTKHEYPN